MRVARARFPTRSGRVEIARIVAAQDADLRSVSAGEIAQPLLVVPPVLARDLHHPLVGEQAQRRRASLPPEAERGIRQLEELQRVLL